MSVDDEGNLQVIDVDVILEKLLKKKHDSG